MRQLQKIHLNERLQFKLCFVLPAVMIKQTAKVKANKLSGTCTANKEFDWFFLVNHIFVASKSPLCIDTMHDENIFFKIIKNCVFQLFLRACWFSLYEIGSQISRIQVSRQFSNISHENEQFKIIFTYCLDLKQSDCTYKIKNNLNRSTLKPSLLWLQQIQRLIIQFFGFLQEQKKPYIYCTVPHCI